MFKPVVVLLSALYFKCILFVIGLYYRLFGKDKNVRMPGYNPGLMYNSRTVVVKKTKTLILIRHAESVWNEVFNREMNWGFPLRFLTGVFCELILFVTNDSYFFDSPLSDRGIKQASDLHRFIRSITENDFPKDMEKSWRALTGNSSSTDTEKKEEAKHIPIITSPLRRCVETVCLALFSRLQKSSKKVVYTHSGLQELTGNFDGISLARRSKLAPLSSTFDILKSYYIMQAQSSHSHSQATVAEEELNDKNKDQLPITQDHHIQSGLQKVTQILENDFKVNLNEIKNTAENAIKENVQKVTENVTATVNLEIPTFAKQKIQETSDLLKSSLPSVKIVEKNELKDLTEEFSMVKNWKEWMSQRMDSSLTDGFKPRAKRGDERIDGFINWLFNEEPCMDSEIVVICGHSAWLRNFFKAYLPRDSTHIAKTHKVQNAGVIQCQVTQFTEPQDPFKKNRYCIQPESIQLVRGSFQRYLKTF